MTLKINRKIEKAIIAITIFTLCYRFIPDAAIEFTDKYFSENCSNLIFITFPPLASLLLLYSVFPEHFSLNFHKKLPYRKIFAAGISFTMLAALCGFIWMLILTSLNYELTEPAINLLFQSQNLWSEKIILFIAAVILAPLAEELIFRKYIFAGMGKLWGTQAAMVLCSGLFAAIHFSFCQFLPLFVLGLSFQYIYLKYRSLFAAVIVHATNNFVSALMLLLFS